MPKRINYNIFELQDPYLMDDETLRPSILAFVEVKINLLASIRWNTKEKDLGKFNHNKQHNAI